MEMIIHQLKSSVMATLLLASIIWAQPFSGGPRVPTVLLIIIGGLVLFKRLVSFHDQRISRITIILALFFIPSLLSLSSSYNLEGTLKQIFILPLFLLFSIAVVYLMDHKFNPRLFYSLVLFVCSFWTFDATVQLLWGHDLFGIPPWPGDGIRIVGPFGDRLRLSLFLSITLPLVLFRLKSTSVLWQLTYLTLVFFIIILSGVRTDLLTALMAIILYIFVNKKTKLLLALIPLLIIAGLIASAQSSVSDSKLKTFSKVPTTFSEWNDASSYRLDIWLTAKNMLVENPAFGIGAKSFSEAYDNFSSGNNILINSETVFHAHHPIISIAAETGLVGLAGLLTIFFLLYKWGRSALKSDLLANPWFQILILMFFPIQSMPLLFTLWWFPFVAMVMLFYLNDIENHGNNSTVSS